ncbi:sensor histidine kinase [Nocardia sp. NPDC046763]|uniref:sensor histidine kinase n=1 Tax=Nocardia sp. NPDC046763 TaxID=3155256 RepID=UPI0033CC168F
MPMSLRLSARARRLFGITHRQAACATVGALIQAGMMIVVILPWRWIPTTLPPVTAVLMIAPTTAVVLATPLLTTAQRNRFRLRGTAIPVPRDERVLWSATRARQLVYHLIVGPLQVCAGIVLALSWLVAIVAGTVLIWMWLVPVGWRLGMVNYAVAWTMTAGAAVFVLAWATPVLLRVDGWTARTLLGPGREELLARRVADLAESRAGVVDAANAERRRIERDLHDGVQQRLVSLAVNLGIARATLTDLPDSARKVIEDAHDQTKQTIAELSHLVRGLHPAVLEDRGLDAALSGIASEAPIPVRLAVRLPVRPPAPVEAIAYFIISEALTNVIKHARATEAEVTVDSTGDRLRITVSDNGLGGADATAGTGLTGLARRVASVDGRFEMTSPVGGPTRLVAELPCGR